MKIEAIDQIIATDYQFLLKEEGETVENYKKTVKKCQDRLWNQLEHLEHCLSFMQQDLKHVFTCEDREALRELKRVENQVRELNNFFYGEEMQKAIKAINN